MKIKDEKLIKDYQDQIIWLIPKLLSIKALETILIIIRRHVKD